MAIRNLTELRAAADPEYKALSDRDLVEVYSSKANIPFADAANFFGVKPGGGLREMGSQALAGLTVDVPSMVGQATKYFSDEGSSAYKFGQGLVAGAERRGMTAQPDVRGRGLFSESMIAGARGIAPVLTTAGVGIATSLAGSPITGAAVTGALSAGLFGGSGGQDTYERVLAETGDVQAATSAGRGSAVVQGLGEAAANIVGGALIKPFAKSAAGATMGTVVNRFTQPRVYKDFGKALAANYATQIGTEVAQDVGTSLIEQRYGAAPEDLGSIAASSAKAAFGMTTILGGFGLGSAAVRKRNADRMKLALEGNPSIPADEQMLAVRRVRQEAEAAGIAPERASAWALGQLRRIDNSVNKPTEKLELAASDFLAAETALEGMDESAPGYQDLIDKRAAAQAQFIEQGDKPSDFTAIDKTTGERRVLTFAELNALGNKMTVPWVADAEVPAQQVGLEDTEVDLTVKPESIESAEGYLSAVTRYEMQRVKQEAEAAAAAKPGKKKTATQAAEKESDLTTTTTATDAETIAAVLDSLDQEAAVDTAAPAGAPVARLPANLRGASPRYKGSELKFESDLDRAAYIIAGEKPSNRDKGYLDFVTTTLGVSETEARALGRQVRTSIAELRKTATDGPITVPNMQLGATTPAAVDTAAVDTTAVDTTAVNTQEVPIEETTLDDAPPFAEDVETDAAAIDRVLNAEVTGGATPMNTGRPSLPNQVFMAIRNAVLSGRKQRVYKPGTMAEDTEMTKQYAGQITEIASAVRAFATAFSKTTGKTQNAIKTATSTFPANMAAEDSAVQAAYEKLSKVVAPRDLDAIVRVVKDRVQKLGTRESGKAKAYRFMDTNLSQGWQAVRAGAYGAGTVDTAFVRSGEDRTSIEQAERNQIFDNLGLEVEPNPLQSAATEGYAVMGKGTADTGIVGILNRLITTGTRYEGVLARALKTAFAKMGDKAPTVEFDDKGPRYSPKENKIYLGEQSSREVQLHEALHGALQWFVYSNREDATVVELMQLVEQVVGYTDNLSGAALEVQQVIAKLYEDGKQLDAVLELISYTNTHTEFRRALSKLQANENLAPKTFMEAVGKIWSDIKAVVNKLIGGGDSVAENVMRRSFELLEKAAIADVNLSAGAAGQDLMIANTKATPTSVGITAPDLRQFDNSAMPSILSTQFIFEALAFDKQAARVKKAGASIAAAIRKDFPGIEMRMAKLYSRFSVPAVVNEFMDTFKNQRNIPYMMMEMVAHRLERSPIVTRQAFAAYLDGDTTALNGIKDSEDLQIMGTAVMNHMQNMIAYLPKPARAYFENKSRKFTDKLIYVESAKQVTPHTFSTVNVSQLLGLETRLEPAITWESSWINKDSNGDPILTDSFYQVSGPDKLDPNGKIVPQGFMSVDKFEANGVPLGATVNTKRVWRIDKKSKDGFKFSSSMTAEQANKELDGTRFTNALRNTMAALAANAASAQYMNNMLMLGRQNLTEKQVKEGVAPDATAVVFDSVEQIEKVLGVKPTKILDASTAEAEVSRIRDKYRVSGTWVKLSGSYGPLKGKLVPGPVYTAMLDMVDRTPLTNMLEYQQMLSFWKKTKTTMNPGTHVTNTLTNFTLMYMHDISFTQIKTAAKVYARFHTSAGSLTKDELNLMESFMQSGAMLGDLSTSEIKRDLYNAMLKADDTDGGIVDKLKTLTGYEQSKAKMMADKVAAAYVWTDEKSSALYAAEDNIFRFALFLKTAAELQGQRKETTISNKTTMDAGKRARSGYVDYDIDSTYIRTLRQSVMPFVSFTYGIIPVLGRIALEKPWKIANVLTAFYITGALMQGLVDDDDEETRKMMPEYIRSRMFGIGPYMHIRLPFGGSEDPMYMRIGDYFPLAGAGGQVPNGIMGQSWIPQGLNPSNPLLTLIATFLTGVDVYTGKPINEVTDTNFQKLVNHAKSAYGVFAPPVVGPSNIGNMRDVITGKTGMTGVTESPAVFARAFLGLRLYQNNLQESEAIRGVIVDGIRRDFQMAMSRAKREEAQSGSPDYEALDKELQKLYERMQKEIDEARGDTAQ